LPFQPLPLPPAATALALQTGPDNGFDVLADSDLMFRPRAGAKRIRFEALVDPTCEPYIEGRQFRTPNYCL
jgi:hypothetical protein